jgi:hypothetical protein
MSMISDWLGYLAWRRGKSLSDLRRRLNQRALDEPWKRSRRVGISKNTITNILRGRTRDWHDESKAFAEAVLSDDFGIDCTGEDAFGPFAATIGAGQLRPLSDAAGGREHLRRYVGLYHLIRQSTSSARINVNPFLIAPVGDGCFRAVLYVGQETIDGLLPRYVGDLCLGTEALYALMIGRSTPDNVRFRSLIMRRHRSTRVTPGLMLQLSDATGAPTALPFILKRVNAAPEVDPASTAFSLKALHELIAAHDIAVPAEGPGALKPSQRRYLERFTPDAEEALNLFS